jgi:hypothetical protein
MIIVALGFVVAVVTAYVYWTKAPQVSAVSPKTISWDPTPNAEHYTLKCGTEPGRYALPPQIVRAPATQVPVQAVATQPGKYFCVVTASNASGESGPSNEIMFEIR